MSAPDPASAERLTAAALATIADPFSFMLQRYRRQPELFVREVLGAEPDPWQLEMLTALGRDHRRLSIRSGHGCGKSAVLAWTMLWHMLTRFPQKTVVTAPSAPQLYDALWSELRTWAARLPGRWGTLLRVKSNRVELVDRPEESFISARTSRAETPEAMAGVHARFVLLVVDEASGVPEPVFETAQGSMSTPGAITLLTGNPTRSSGFFWRTHHVEADRWWTRHVSSIDSPRVDRAFVEDIVARYGRDSNAFRVRVLGEFPLSESNTLIPAVLVEQAMERAVDPDPEARIIWGVDPARFGADKSVLIKRAGWRVIEAPRDWSGLDTMQLTGQIRAEWDRTPGPFRPVAIVVDAIGIGAGVEDRLREQDLPTIGVNVGESPSVEGRFRRMRDQLWQECADWLASNKVELPWHERLRDDLASARYSFLSDGKLIVESKAEMRARGLPSCDFADALCLTFAPAALTATSLSRIRWHQRLRRGIKGIV